MIQIIFYTTITGIIIYSNLKLRKKLIEYKENISKNYNSMIQFMEIFEDITIKVKELNERVEKLEQ